jgi:hypothetical protein
MAPPNLPRCLGTSAQMVDQDIGIEKFADRLNSRRTFS